MIREKEAGCDPGQRLPTRTSKARGLRKAYCEVRVAVDSLVVIVFHGKAAVGNGGCIDSEARAIRPATTPEHLGEATTEYSVVNGVEKVSEWVPSPP